MSRRKKHAVVIGAGPAGLAAALELQQQGWRVTVLEAENRVGGLSATLVHDSYRYDIGGHRFFTKEAKVNEYFLDLLRGDVVPVARESRIYFGGRYFNYPLSFWNALLGMGPTRSVEAVGSYLFHRSLDRLGLLPRDSFEGWMVAHFGRRLYETFFQAYTSKVWGIPCDRLSADWASQRIRGMSLGAALKRALRLQRQAPLSLVEEFHYPRLGIGQMSDRAADRVRQSRGQVHTATPVVGLESTDRRVAAAVLANGDRIEADGFVHTGPLDHLVSWLAEKPLHTAAPLQWRGLVTVFIELDIPRMSRSHWIYFPGEEVPFGRIHEPKNWSREMAPATRTGVVAEYFAFPGDRIWNLPDEALIQLTGETLARLKFVPQGAWLGGRVDRFVHAYPTYMVGYREATERRYQVLARYDNLIPAGRTGLFRYHNIDHAIETGWEAASRLATGKGDPFSVNEAKSYHEELESHVE